MFKLGQNVYTGEELFFIPVIRNDKLCGNFLIAGAPGTGKTIILRNLYIQMAEYERILVFDCHVGEHKLSMIPNFKSREIIKAINFKVIENFGFFLSDFQRMDEWMSLGLQPSTAQIMSSLVRNYNAHLNYPERMLKILQQLPTTYQAVPFFNEEYGYQLGSKINDQIKMSLIKNFTYFTENNYFKSPDDDLNYINNWGELLKENHLLIIIEGGDIEINKTRLYIGKILSFLTPWLERIQPKIFIEEADRLFPELKAEEILPLSLRQAIAYSLKHQKKGVAMFFVCQDLNLLHSSIVVNWSGAILGPGQPYRDFMNYTKYLQWQPEINLRQFCYVRRGTRNYFIFKPMDSCSLLP